jgi:hypothetical protein
VAGWHGFFGEGNIAVVIEIIDLRRDRRTTRMTGASFFPSNDLQFIFSWVRG